MNKNQKAYFVTGTDTDVGKTWLSAALLQTALDMKKSICYHKPIQCGTDDDLIPTGGDPARVKSLVPGNYTCNYGTYLSTPCSPHLAFQKENKHFHLENALKAIDNLPESECTIIEGAGGIRVPISPKFEMLDLIKELRIPVVLCARPLLGTLNHSLLSIDSLLARGIQVAGIVFSNKPNTITQLEIEILLENAIYIEKNTGVQYLGTLPQIQNTMTEYRDWKHHPIANLWN